MLSVAAYCDSTHVWRWPGIVNKNNQAQCIVMLCFGYVDMCNVAWLPSTHVQKLSVLSRAMSCCVKNLGVVARLQLQSMLHCLVSVANLSFEMYKDIVHIMFADMYCCLCKYCFSQAQISG